MKKILMTILKSFAILIGVTFSVGALNSFGTNPSGTGAAQAGAYTGTVMLLIIGIALIVLPAVSIYRSFTAKDN